MSNITHILHLVRQLQNWASDDVVPTEVLIHELDVIAELLEQEADGGFSKGASPSEPASGHGSDRQSSLPTGAEVWDGEDA
jgi:hypothetical protein